MHTKTQQRSWSRQRLPGPARPSHHRSVLRFYETEPKLSLLNHVKNSDSERKSRRVLGNPSVSQRIQDGRDLRDHWDFPNCRTTGDVWTGFLSVPQRQSHTQASLGTPRLGKVNRAPYCTTTQNPVRATPSHL